MSSRRDREMREPSGRYPVRQGNRNGSYNPSRHTNHYQPHSQMLPPMHTNNNYAPYHGAASSYQQQQQDGGSGGTSNWVKFAVVMLIALLTIALVQRHNQVGHVTHKLAASKQMARDIHAKWSQRASDEDRSHASMLLDRDRQHSETKRSHVAEQMRRSKVETQLRDAHSLLGEKHTAITHLQNQLAETKEQLQARVVTLERQLASCQQTSKLLADSTTDEVDDDADSVTSTSSRASSKRGKRKQSDKKTTTEALERLRKMNEEAIAEMAKIHEKLGGPAKKEEEEEQADADGDDDDAASGSRL